ncbi:MAG: response regulator [Thermodesulfobacteriota bacterium]
MDRQSRVIHILLVEDNPAEAAWVKDVLKEHLQQYRLTVVQDGDTALAYLRAAVPVADSTRPDLLILDVRAAKMSGRELLAVMRKDPALRRIPVIILGAPASRQDIDEYSDPHDNPQFVKRADLAQVFQVIRALEEFWLSTVVLLRAAGFAPDEEGDEVVGHNGDLPPGFPRKHS